MKPLPYADPGTPDTRSPMRFTLWVARQQWRTLAAGSSCAIVWMLCVALLPAVVSRAIDQGIRAHDAGALVRWALVAMGLGVLSSVAGLFRHRFAVINWLRAALRCIQLVGEHVSDTGEALPRVMPTGQVVASATTDSPRFAESFDASARFVASIVSYLVVAGILLTSSVRLGLVVLFGVPVLLATLAFVMRPLQRRQRAQREEFGRLAELGSDTVAGLRVLRGIGGEATFERRYAEQSDRVRREGVRVAVPQSTLDSTQILLPGIFMVIVTWLGARSVHAGEITPGQLVAFYGYSTFLVMPLSMVSEWTGKILATRIAAGRIIDVLRIEGDHVGEHPTARLAPGPQVLADPTSGVRAEPGQLTAVVSAVPAQAAALADRLGRFGREGSGATYGGVHLGDVPVREVRSRIVVSQVDPRLFSGVLREQLDPHGNGRTVRLPVVLEALDAADAHDVLTALEDGLESRVEERGRSFSGGQRQRLALTRALLTDAETLVLVEPTSAVDAHTEARIAGRLADARRGRTTVVMSASPLLLDHADRVLLLHDGQVVAEGTHTQLSRDNTAYRRVVLRDLTDTNDTNDTEVADEPAHR